MLFAYFLETIESGGYIWAGQGGGQPVRVAEGQGQAAEDQQGGEGHGRFGGEKAV